MTIAEVQTVRKFVLATAIVLCGMMCAVTTSQSEVGMPTHEAIEWFGVVLIVGCIVGRMWCTLYIGGRKIDHLVTHGPYSVCRNPLYLFSVLGAAGAGAQLGSVMASVICGVLAWIVFYVVVLQEERLLADRHGVAYATYIANVPRFLPDPTIWRDVPTVTAWPARLLRTGADAMLLLLAVPLAEVFEKLQEMQALPVLFRLP